MGIDRRQLIALGALGLGAAGFSRTSAAVAKHGFTHGVASGEPGPRSILLWTRYVGHADATQLTVEFSDDADFASARNMGEARALSGRDHIAKITIDGLMPGYWYFYRFVAPDGSKSPVGRTRTLPEGQVAKFGLGLFSCANLPFGHFTAYAHAAKRDDIDLMVHVGDYLYEYQSGNYPAKEDILPGRQIKPEHELVTLDDYRLRYATYRADPDLQRLHQLFPMIAMWDDHELSNDAWKGGAQNHQPDSEGGWPDRMAAAEQAWRDWMPVRDIAPGEPRWSSYQIGDLLTLMVTESRLSARDRQADLRAVMQGQDDPVRALVAFRDGDYLDPNREMLGREQQQWLNEAMAASVKGGTRWQVLAQQCIVGNLLQPENWQAIVTDKTPAPVRARVERGAAFASLGLPTNMDSWDGYPAARTRLLEGAQQAGADLIVLTGDSHNSWAFNLTTDAGPVGVEFAGPSVTSPGLEINTPGIEPAAMASAMIAANAGLDWAETSRRGYVSVMLSQEQAVGQWHLFDTVRKKAGAIAETVRKVVPAGQRRIA